MSDENKKDEWIKAMADLEDKHGTLTADGAAIVRKKKSDDANPKPRDIPVKITVEGLLRDRVRAFSTGVDLFWSNGKICAHVKDEAVTHWDESKTLDIMRWWLREQIQAAFEAGYEDGKAFEAGFEREKEDTVSAERQQEIGERRAMLWIMELLGFHPRAKEDDFRVATIKLKEELPRMIKADRHIAFGDGVKSVRKQIEDYLRNRKLRLDQAVEECNKIEDQMSAAKKKRDDLKSEMAALIEVASMISEPDRE